MAYTRAFGAPIEALAPLIEAVSEFAAKACAKLRRQHSLAGQVMVFVGTSPFRKTPQYSRSITVPLPEPSCDSMRLTAAAVMGLKAIYAPGYDMARAGVILLDLREEGCEQLQLQLDMEGQAVASRGRSRLMLAMDAINLRFGSDTMKVGSGRVGATPCAWVARQTGRTPEYTTDWAQLPVVRA